LDKKVANHAGFILLAGLRKSYPHSLRHIKGDKLSKERTVKHKKEGVGFLRDLAYRLKVYNGFVLCILPFL
jgi:hypothetical protein